MRTEVYTANQASRICGVTLRQLQFWDETGVLSPRQELHKRLYTAEEIELLRRIRRLRECGIGLKRLRKYLEWKYSAVMKITGPTVVGGILVIPR